MLTEKEKAEAIALANEAIGRVEKAYTAFEGDFRLIIKGNRYTVDKDENGEIIIRYKP